MSADAQQTEKYKTYSTAYTAKSNSFTAQIKHQTVYRKTNTVYRISCISTAHALDWYYIVHTGA